MVARVHHLLMLKVLRRLYLKRDEEDRWMGVLSMAERDLLLEALKLGQRRYLN